jgi:CheY-like chemotaxis protein
MCDDLAMTTKPPTIFLSYASPDLARVTPYFEHLQARGFEVWMDCKKLKAGQHWGSEIRRALDEAAVIVVFVSANSIDRRGYVQREIKIALEKAEEKLLSDIYLIPVIIDDNVEIPVALKHLHCINAREGDAFAAIEDALKYQLDIISGYLLATKNQGDATLNIGFSPYCIEDMLHCGVNNSDLIAFITIEKDRHPELFKSILSSLPLMMANLIVVINWNFSTVIVERVLRRSEAYPLASSWTSTLSQYRRSLNLRYRRPNKLHHSHKDYDAVIIQYGLLINAMKSYNDQLLTYIGKGYEMQMLMDLYEEAIFYADNDIYESFISTVEALLSISHKLLLKHLPTVDARTPSTIETLTSMEPGNGVTSAPIDAALVLLVEDDPALRKALEKVLRDRIDSLNVNIVSAESGLEALRLSANKTVALLITDLVMRLMDGVQLAKMIKSINPKTKIMVISGFTTAINRLDDIVVDKILPKPFDNKELIESVLALLRSYSRS